MSVLVEALSLIVPRKVLDAHYPGGTDAFMTKMCEPDVPCRLVCADEELVSVSFLTAEEARVVETELTALGIVDVENDQFQDMAFVDQLYGPTMPCEWLEWKQDPQGFTYCWVAGADPDPMVAPENWTPEQSRALVRRDVRDEPGRCLKLAEENGLETWLDFKTGEIMIGLPQRSTAKGPNAPTAPSPHREAAVESDELFEEDSTEQESALLGVIAGMLETEGYRHSVVSARRITLSMAAEHGVYNFFFVTDDDRDFVGIVGNCGAYVPAERRDAVAVAIARINSTLSIGGFQLQFSDGELQYRIGMDVEDGTMSRKMADNMLSCCLFTMDAWQPVLMRIAFGDLDPDQVLEERA